MLRVAICDDRREAIEQYAGVIARIAEKHNIAIEISSYSSGEELLFYLSDPNEQADIIYLDILMGKINGMETARQLRNRGRSEQIIFLTNHEGYVYDAFDVEAGHYLLKGEVPSEKFEQVFLTAVERAIKRKKAMFSREYAGQTFVIPIDQIVYCETWRRLVTVHYGVDQTAKFYEKMDQLEKELSDKNFVRAHRSYLVHLPYIAKFQRKSMLLTTGEVIPVGVTYAQALEKAFSAYIARAQIFDFANRTGAENKR